MEGNPCPGASSQVDSEETLQHIAAPSKSPVPTVVSTAENARQKRNRNDCENLESVKRGKNPQGQAIIRRMINLLNNVEELMSEDDRNNSKDEHHHDNRLDVTLVLGQDHLRIGCVTLKNASNNHDVQHDDHLHEPRKLTSPLYEVGGARKNVNSDDQTTQLMAQAQQLRDSQDRIDTLHTQLFDLRSRLYEVEHAHSMAEYQRMLKTTRGSREHRRTKKPHSPPPKRKSMVHEYYPDGGQSIRWLTDEEFEPYGEPPADEGSSPVVKAVPGPLSCGLAARRSMSLSRRWALRRFQKAREAAAADLHSDESSTSSNHRRAAGSPEI
ncbi:hypothetical protein EDD22DRAFT_954807 [Suillus occidentalis]|nr:hypothetical protein EDD22DRAFT_954807 [Suillus occidentalis]